MLNPGTGIYEYCRPVLEVHDFGRIMNIQLGSTTCTSGHWHLCSIPHVPCRGCRDGIFKLLMSPGIDSMESILLAYTVLEFYNNLWGLGTE
jgi:hypothetical protein